LYYMTKENDKSNTMKKNTNLESQKALTDEKKGLQQQQRSTKPQLIKEDKKRDKKKEQRKELSEVVHTNNTKPQLIKQDKKKEQRKELSEVVHTNNTKPQLIKEDDKKNEQRKELSEVVHTNNTKPQLIKQGKKKEQRKELSEVVHTNSTNTKRQPADSKQSDDDEVGVDTIREDKADSGISDEVAKFVTNFNISGIEQEDNFKQQVLEYVSRIQKQPKRIFFKVVTKNKSTTKIHATITALETEYLDLIKKDYRHLFNSVAYDSHLLGMYVPHYVQIALYFGLILFLYSSINYYNTHPHTKQNGELQMSFGELIIGNN
jgi:hypothetical protein